MTAENRRQPAQASTRHEPELGKRRFEQRIAERVTGSAPPVQVAAIDGLDGEALGQEGIEYSFDRSIEPLIQDEPPIFSGHLR